MTPSDVKATLSFSDGSPSMDLPLYKGTIGPDVIDIRKLYAQTGAFTYDPGFTSTASCDSALTYIDGDEGVLLYRGIPIEQVPAWRLNRSVAYVPADGVLFRGASGSAGEVGHMTIQPDGAPCACGSRGCWETTIGAEAVAEVLGLEPDDDVSAALADVAAARASLGSADGIFIVGGETFVLLAALHRDGLLELIRSRVRSGMPFAGSSAGANVAGLVIGRPMGYFYDDCDPEIAAVLEASLEKYRSLGARVVDVCVTMSQTASE